MADPFLKNLELAMAARFDKKTEEGKRQNQAIPKLATAGERKHVERGHHLLNLDLVKLFNNYIIEIVEEVTKTGGKGAKECVLEKLSLALKSKNSEIVQWMSRKDGILIRNQEEGKLKPEEGKSWGPFSDPQMRKIEGASLTTSQVLQKQV